VASNNNSEGTPDVVLLHFTPGNWNVTQTVTVTGQDDFVHDGDVPYTVSVAPSSSNDPQYAALGAAGVALSNTDDDFPGITITPSGLTTTEGGGTVTLSIVLDSQPAAAVQLNFASSDNTEASLSANTLIFNPANWNVVQTIT